MIFAGLLCAPFLWGLYCNTATYFQRRQAGVRVFALDSLDFRWMLFSDELLAVGYTKHFTWLLIGRSPWTLYSPELRAFLGK